MNDADVMACIIKYLIRTATNKEYIKTLEIILKGIDGKLHIEESFDPRYQSIILFGYNIFPFKMKEYRLIADFIQGESKK